MSTSDVVQTNSAATTTAANQSMPVDLHAQPAVVPDVAPPPYPHTGYASSTEDDDEDGDKPVTLVINAANAIKGDCNLVRPMPVVDAAKLSAMLMASIKQMIQPDPKTAPASRPKINLTINCGVTVIGNRNVIGNMAIKPPGGPAGTTTAGAPKAPVMPAVAGTKRGASDEGTSPAPKSKAQKVTATTK